MLHALTDQQIDQRLTLVEGLIWTCDDPKRLPALNQTFQKLIDEQVRRDLIHQPNVRAEEFSDELSGILA